MKIMGSLKKLRVKLLISFLIAAVIPVCMLGIISWLKFSEALQDQVYKQLESVREIKKVQIKNYLMIAGMTWMCLLRLHPRFARNRSAS